MKFVIMAWLASVGQAWSLSFVTEDYPPFNYISDYGYLSGSSTQIIEEMLKRSKLTASITVYPWARAYKMAKDTKEVCVFTTTRTDERERHFKWVGPLSTDSWSLYAKASSSIAINTLGDALIYRIGAANEGAQAAYLRAGGFNVDTANSEALNLKKLMAGRFDFWAVGSVSGEWLAKTHGASIKKVFTFREVAVYLACNPTVADSEVKRMNDSIRDMKLDGYIDKITSLYK